MSEKIREAVMCDLDNCLVDDAWRIPQIDWNEKDPDVRYARYHASAAEDGRPDEALVAVLAAHVAEGRKIIFATARPEKFREQTWRWLELHIWPPLGDAAAKAGLALDVQLMMRPPGDHSASPLMKRKMLGWAQDPNNVEAVRVVHAYDDRPDVIAMYVGNGVMACHHQLHDVDAYSPPIAPARGRKWAGECRANFTAQANFGGPPPSSPEAPKIDLIDVASPDVSRAPDFLEAGAETFRQRNAIFGDTYLLFGPAMAAAFPEGLKIEPGDVESFNRLGVWVQCMGKLLRYGPQLSSGGHRDSAHDLMVYGAILEEVTKK